MVWLEVVHSFGVSYVYCCFMEWLFVSSSLCLLMAVGVLLDELRGPVKSKTGTTTTMATITVRTTTMTTKMTDDDGNVDVKGRTR